MKATIAQIKAGISFKELEALLPPVTLPRASQRVTYTAPYRCGMNLYQSFSQFLETCAKQKQPTEHCQCKETQV
jgi:hypothetical protein